MTARNPSTSQPVVDPQTGTIKPEWLRYFIALAEQGVNLQKRDAAPASPAEGDAYYDLTLHKARMWDGTTWQNWW